MSEQNTRYQPAPGRTALTAWVVFGLSVAAAAGFLLVLPPLVMLIVAVVTQKHVLAGDRRGYWLATAGGGVSAAAFLFGLLIAVAPGCHGRELANRSTCAVNVRGIMQSMAAYAADNEDCYPLVSFGLYGAVASAPTANSTGTHFGDAAVRRYYQPPFPQAGNVEACLWILVLEGQVSAKQFICKSDSFADSVTAEYAASDAPSGGTFDNFQNDKQLSYSMAYPWAADGKPGAWWHNTVDASLPLMADMAPRQGTGTPARDLTPGAAPTDGHTWNSGNHAGEGQNVAFADGHAEFCRRPDVGQKNDNIYSMSGLPSTGPGQFGGVPAGKAAPQLTAEKTPFDVVMLPVRDETTGGM